MLFTTALSLVETLELAELKGELKKKIAGLLKFDLIITINKDFTNRGEFFHGDNVAVPIVDRLIHHSYIFMLGGESYRLKQKLGS